MASYKEFHNEKYYDAPDIGILERGLVSGARATGEAIGNLFRSISEQQRAKRAAADQYKFDLGEAKFENDDKIIYQGVLNETELSKQDIRTTGRISPERLKSQQQWTMNKKSSDWQYKKFENNEKEIIAREKEDIYYDGLPDREGNKLAAYGENNDVYYATRGERLEAFDKIKGKLPQSLKGKLYTADYVKTFGKKENTKAFGDPNVESSTYDATPFLTPQGTPGVTIDHAKEYLNSRPDGSVARWIEYQVDEQMNADVKYNKSHNEKLKGMSDEEAKLYLKANPRENLYNQKDFATRVIEKAQDEMIEAASIASKTDYQTKVDKSVTGGLYTNDAIGHSYTDHVDEPVVAGGKNVVTPTGGFNVNLNIARNNMPGGNLRIGKGVKIGQAIPVDLNPRKSFNVRTGKSQGNTGTTSFNITGYQTAVLSNDGSVYATDLDVINKIPAKDKANLQPELGVVLRGYTIDKGNMLGELASRQSELDNEIAAAIANGDTEKQASTMSQLDKLKSLSQMINLSRSEFSDDDLMSALRQNGVSLTSIKRDVIITPSDADFAIVDKNLTRGLNLKDKSKWSPDMLNANKTYQEGYQKSAAAGFKESEPKVEPKPTKPAKKSKIPEGNIEVISPDGRRGHIPASQLPDALQAGYKQTD